MAIVQHIDPAEGAILLVLPGRVSEDGQGALWWAGRKKRGHGVVQVILRHDRVGAGIADQQSRFVEQRPRGGLVRKRRPRNLSVMRAGNGREQSI